MARMAGRTPTFEAVRDLAGSGKPVPAPRPATLADGMTPPFVGALPLAIAKEAAVDNRMVDGAPVMVVASGVNLGPNTGVLVLFSGTVADGAEIYQALVDLKVPVEYMLYPREPHGFVELVNSVEKHAATEVAFARRVCGLDLS